MTRKLLPNTEILRVITLAQEVGITIAGLDVGIDYVRVIAPAQGGDPDALHRQNPRRQSPRRTPHHPRKVNRL